MDILVICFQSLAVILSFFFIIFVVHQRHSLLCSYLLLYSIAVFVNEFAYLLEIKSAVIEEALMAVRFEYITQSAATAAALFFTCELFQVKIRPWLKGLYISAFIVTCTFVVTNPLHHLHYKTCFLEVREHFSVLHMEIGMIYVIHTALTLISMAVCIGVIAVAWIRD
ncbi:MAG: histidine kinase N-terminal 7TM domain-containing protein, partial [Lachnospiraceae bacterium]